MKIKITNEAKRWLTVAEMPMAKEMIEDFKFYDDTPMDILRATHIASGTDCTFKILSYSAEIAGNDRIDDYYLENSGRLDIWVEAYTYNEYIGFYDIGFYLSDIWGYTESKKSEVLNHMTILKFVNADIAGVR